MDVCRTGDVDRLNAAISEGVALTQRGTAGESLLVGIYNEKEEEGIEEKRREEMIIYLYLFIFSALGSRRRSC